MLLAVQLGCTLTWGVTGELVALLAALVAGVALLEAGLRS